MGSPTLGIKRPCRPCSQQKAAREPPFSKKDPLTLPHRPGKQPPHPEPRLHPHNRAPTTVVTPFTSPALLKTRINKPSPRHSSPNLSSTPPSTLPHCANAQRARSNSHIVRGYTSMREFLRKGTMVFGGSAIRLLIYGKRRRSAERGRRVRRRRRWC